jgi:hypothetical protein
MPKIAMAVLLLLGMAGRQPAKPSDTIADIDFFGYAGLDVAKVRASLPVHSGDVLTEQTKSDIKEAVAGVLGKEPTDVAVICCDAKGMSLVYIGLPGGYYKPFALNPVPSGADRLPKQIVKLNDRLWDAMEAAVKEGAAEEDDSQGYALVKDPKARSLELRERQWALAHGPELLRVLRWSSDATQREVASEVLGYAQQSHEQIAALEDATRDSDSVVRNNATRALMVLVSSNTKLAVELDPSLFLEMLGSGTWTDHNKAVGLLESMSRGRDPQLLAKIRAQGLVPLTEMASWSEPGHAMSARLILGRIAGVPEDKLGALAWNGPLNAILDAIPAH